MSQLTIAMSVVVNVWAKLKVIEYLVSVQTKAILFVSNN